MQKYFDKKAKILSIILLFVFSAIFYRVLLYVDETNCYKRLALELGMVPNLAEVYNSLYADIKSKLQNGMNYEQSYLALDEDWNYEIIWRRKDLNGGYKEYVKINYCYFSMNDFSFLFRYSKDWKLIELIKYIDD